MRKIEIEFSVYIGLFIFINFIFSSNLMAMPNEAPMAIFVPDTPVVEHAKTVNKNSAKTKNAPSGKKSEPKTSDEVDLLVSMIKPHTYAAFDMDRPQFLGMIFYPEQNENGEKEPLRKDLLGDMEEIRYLDKKAWATNVSVEKPGLYQFVLETRPWWDEERDMFIQHQGKILLPVRSTGYGWSIPTGQSLEIVPLNRPLGMLAPALFSGKVLVDDKPMANVPVFMGKMNTAKSEPISAWHTSMEARTGETGEFSFILNQPGWWYCEAQFPGDPLKGPDGNPKKLERFTVLWIYVDGPADNKSRK